MKKILRRLFSFIYTKMLSANLTHRLYMLRKQYDIDLSVNIGFNTLIYGTGKIIIGKNTYFGNNCMIESSEPCTILIGSGCAFAHNIQIRTSAYDISSGSFAKARLLPNKCRSISIGNNVWCGCNVFINDGVTIGDNVVIGANSVVTKDLLSNGVYGGVPAKLIRAM